MRNDSSQIAVTLAILPLALLLIVMIGIPVMLMDAWAFVTLWRWYAVPTFGLPAIHYPQACGIALLVGTMRYAPKYKDHEVDWISQLIGALLGPPMAVLVGWIFLHWMGA